MEVEMHDDSVTEFQPAIYQQDEAESSSLHPLLIDHVSLFNYPAVYQAFSQ